MRFPGTEARAVRVPSDRAADRVPRRLKVDAAGTLESCRHRLRTRQQITDPMPRQVPSTRLVMGAPCDSIVPLRTLNRTLPAFSPKPLKRLDTCRFCSQLLAPK